MQRRKASRIKENKHGKNRPQPPRSSRIKNKSFSQILFFFSDANPCSQKETRSTRSLLNFSSNFTIQSYSPLLSLLQFCPGFTPVQGTISVSFGMQSDCQTNPTITKRPLLPLLFYDLEKARRSIEGCVAKLILRELRARKNVGQ